MRTAIARLSARASDTARPGPRRFTVDVNAGRLPADHWTLDPRQGGGRIVGEACHFVDLLRFLSGSAIATAHFLSRDGDGQDGGCFEMKFANGDIAALNYRTDLPAHLPKERMAVAGDGWSAEIDNWKSLSSQNLPGISAPPAWLGGPAGLDGATLQRLRAALSEMRARREAAAGQFRADALGELNRTLGELNALEQMLGHLLALLVGQGTRLGGVEAGRA